MDSENRFATLAESELKQILDDKDSKKTKDVVKYALRIFDSYCAEKGINIIKIETKTAQDLCSFLRVTYAEVRRGNGELDTKSLYAKRSLIIDHTAFLVQDLLPLALVITFGGL